MFKPEVEAGKVRISENERGLIISLVGADYFYPGSAILTPSIRETLKKAAGLIHDLERFVRVEGHSDDDAVNPVMKPGRDERDYINNWDLAGARAVNATVFLIGAEDIDPSWFQAVSFGSYRPMIMDNEGTPEAKAFNRRIDIVILTEKSTKRAPGESNYGLPGTRLPNTETNIEGDQ